MSQNLEELQTSEPEKAREYASKMQTALIQVGFWKTCLNCQHWKIEEVEHCDLWNLRPPTEVIVIGCSSWLRHCPF